MAQVNLLQTPLLDYGTIHHEFNKFEVEEIQSLELYLNC